MAFFSQQPPSYDDAPTTLTPYLTLPHLLSLTWLAYPIISLIFVAFRLSASLDSTQNAISSAKDNLLASCKAAEEAATAAASMPRFMALATNEQFADAVNASLRGARQALILSLTVMEAIINFIIDLYRSIFLCFLELVVRGGLAILIGAVDELNKAVQAVAGGLRDGIQASIGGFIGTLRSTIEGINNALPFGLGKIAVPDLQVPNLDGLNDIKIPASFQESLEQLNATIPTVSDIKGKLEEIINTPFELLKKDINDTFAGIEFRGSALPVPQQNKLVFCDKMDTSVVDNIGRDIIKSFKLGILILVLLALLLIGLNCLLTWYKWRSMKAHLEYTRQAWMTDPTMVHAKGSTMDSTPQVTLNDHNLMVLNANSAHPLVTRLTNQVSQKLKLKPRNHTKLQWFFSYIFHPPAAACLLIGVFGLLLIEVQLLAMGPMVEKYKGQAADSARDFSLFIADSINQSMLNQSAQYAREVNLKVDGVQNTLNDGVFGWVDVTTTQINTTINEFYTDLENGVNKVFGGTILATPATEFIRCLIGSKVDAIENALTFLHDNLRVDMPRVNETVLMLSPEAVNEASAPIAAAAIGGSGDGNGGDDGGLVGRLVNGYANQLKKERVTFAIFLGLWGFVVLMGVGVLLWHSFGAPAVERRRRKRYLLEQRDALPQAFPVSGNRDGTMTPRENSLNLTRDSHALEGKWDGNRAAANDLPQFTPLPSPRQTTFFKPFWKPDSHQVEDGIHHEPIVSKESFAANGQDKSQSKMRRLMSFKNVGKGDAEAQADNSQSGWLGRVRKSAFGGKKEEKVDYDFWEKGKTRPQIKIVVDTASDRSFVEAEHEREPAADKSRWSDSPPEPSTLSGWKSVMLPSTKKETSEPLAGSTVPAARRTPPSPPGLRREPSVSHGIGASLEDPFGSVSSPTHTRTVSDPFNNPASIVPSAYPVPLHSAYYNPTNSPSTQPPPTRSARSSPSHKRTSSVPVWRVTNGSPDDHMSVSSTASRPTLQHPAGLGAAADNAPNPFVTPFDDEHRVRIVKPGVMRKSLKAENPFGGY